MFPTRPFDPLAANDACAAFEEEELPSFSLYQKRQQVLGHELSTLSIS